ncbi:MAG: YhbY family RNA-binding protein [Ferrovum sp.]|nr:YhbY family RNA-binding protein [Ferrovum sp.]NDU87337.1 YhbY family RNA-binding protein [Ferrovum sp.]
MVEARRPRSTGPRPAKLVKDLRDPRKSRTKTSARPKVVPKPPAAVTLPEGGVAGVLSPAQRVALRQKAHALNPVVLLGQAGLTDAVMLEIERALRAHELIKIKAKGSEKEDRTALIDAICSRLSAAPVQQIGKVFVLYRSR